MAKKTSSKQASKAMLSNRFYTPKQISLIYKLDVKRVYKAIKKLKYTKGYSNYKLSESQVEAIITAEKLMSTKKQQAGVYPYSFKSSIVENMLQEKLKAEKDRLEFNKLVGTLAITTVIVGLILILIVLF